MANNYKTQIFEQNGFPLWFNNNRLLPTLSSSPLLPTPARETLPFDAYECFVKTTFLFSHLFSLLPFSSLIVSTFAFRRKGGDFLRKTTDGVDFEGGVKSFQGLRPFSQWCESGFCSKTAFLFSHHFQMFLFINVLHPSHVTLTFANKKHIIFIFHVRESLWSQKMVVNIPLSVK